MIVKINGKHTFFYGSFSQKRKKRYKYAGSLLGIFLGIFLIPQIAYFSDISSEKLIELTNEERILKGLDTLSANQLLTSAAYKKGEAIFDKQEFAHTVDNKKFSEWIKEAEYKYSFIGENLAIDFVSSEGVIQGWLNSPSHKENLLSSVYKEIGIAVIEGSFQGENTILVVQIFGTPPRTAIQPKVLGIHNNNFLNTSYQTINSEKLLTHSISNNYKINSNGNFTINNNDFLKEASFADQAINSLNTFFIQYNTKIMETVLLYILTAVLFFFITNAYITSFTKLKI